MINYTIKVKAIFKGKDGSCGYKTNSQYNFHVRHEKGKNIKIEDSSNGGLPVEYESMMSFLENWDDIRNV